MTLSRLSLLAAALLGTAFIVVELELGEALWRSCFERMLDRSVRSIASPTGDLPYQPIDAWGIALKALMHPSKGSLLLAAMMFPALAAIVVGRRPALAWVALVPMFAAVWLVLDPNNLHDCDRKGSGGYLAVFSLMLFFQLPISIVVLIGLVLDRLRSPAQVKSSQ